MERMTQDMTMVKEKQTKFEQYLGTNPNIKPGIAFSVTVLRTGCWPSYKASAINLPDEMVKCVEVFKEFFKPEKQDEISTQLNLSDEDVVRLFTSLSCAKYKILIKEPNTKTVKPDDSFVLNSKFTDRMRKIRIPLPPMVDEKKNVTEDVEKEREYSIDAALVRIMKSSKILGHQKLIMECVEMLQPIFKPDVKAIKKCIENLIALDYMERDKEDSSIFKYLA